MKPGQKRSTGRWLPHSQGGRRALGRLVATALSTALVALTAVVAQETATLGALFEQVVIKQQIFVKAVAAEKKEVDQAKDAEKKDGDQAKDAEKKAPGKTKTIVNPAGKTKKTIVAKKAVPAKRVVVMANANNVNPMVQQFLQQGRPMMHAELLFARGLLKLDRPTLVKIYPEINKALEDVAKKLAEGQMGVRAAGQKNLDASTLLTQSIAAVFKKHLTAEQYKIYETETARRVETRKKSAVRFLVDSIDRQLLLSDDQRTKITASIQKNWDENWTMYTEYLLYGNQFFPNDIDKYVTPPLNETQKKIWATTQKVNGFWGFGGIWMFNGQEDPVASLLGLENKKDEAPAGPLAKAAAPAVKAEKKAEKKAEVKAETKDEKKAGDTAASKK